MIPDAAELMHAAQSPDDSMIPDRDMTAQSAVIGKNDMIPDRAVMGDMGIGQKIAMTPDLCRRTGRGSPVHRDTFPEGIVIADFQKGRLFLVFQILGSLSDRAEGIELISVTDQGRTHHGDMVVQVAPFTEHHSGPNEAEGPDER